MIDHERQPSPTAEPSGIDDAAIAAIASDVLAGNPITRAQAEALTTARGDTLYDLFYFANKVRVKFVGSAVHFCSILASKVGACSEDCSYCAQSKQYTTHVTPAKSSVQEMQQACDEAAGNGASSFGLVNSGKGPTDKELDWMEPFFKKTAEEGKIRPCATLGELTPEQAQRLKSMGVERVNHNLETSERFFGNIVSTHTYEDRVRTIKNAKAAGMSICSGGIFGMGETWADRLDVAFALRELGADVVPVNFLNAIQGTPLYQEQPPLQPLEALQILALFRFILPDKEIKVAGGREKILREMQSWMFFAGASSFLIGNYLTTFGRTPAQDHQLLEDLGMPYLTYDEVEHTADPQAARSSGPSEGLMSRRDGAYVALPVLGDA